MLRHFNTLLHYRDLLWLWIAREVRIRYKQSILGVAWALLQPLVLTLVFTIVFSRLVRVDTGGIPYPIFAYTALLPWSFFATSLSFGIPSLVNNMNLVTKIYFPREVLPLASIGAAFVDFLAASVVFVGMMVVYRAWPTGPEALWVVPLVLLQIILTIGVTLVGATIIVFFRDMRFVVPLMTQVWMYACPIIYPTEMVPEWLQPYYFLNPMAGIIDGYRCVLLEGASPRPVALLPALIVSCVLCLAGYSLFKRTEPVFADLI